MQQQISVITLGVDDLKKSRRFYADGFGWSPVFEQAEIIFYQMNGLVLGTWLRDHLVADVGQELQRQSGAITLAHNVPTQQEVAPLMQHLSEYGGRILKPAATTAYGGFSGYLADSDGHIWEIAWNPAWAIAADGRVTFSL